MNTDSQNKTVLDMLKNGKKLTQKDALEFGCYRLSARILDLKELGHDIKSERINVIKTNNKTARVALYSI
jgi:hypothetical protein